MLADQIILSSNYLCLTLDKEGWKWVWGRRGKWSLAWGMIDLPIFLLHKECEIYGWVLLYNPLLVPQCSEDAFPMLQASSAQPLFLAHATVLLAVRGKPFLQPSSRQWLNATVCIRLHDKRWKSFAYTSGQLPFFRKIFPPWLYLNITVFLRFQTIEEDIKITVLSAGTLSLHSYIFLKDNVQVINNQLSSCFSIEKNSITKSCYMQKLTVSEIQPAQFF